MRAPSELEWDENKRRRLLDERGLDILYAALIFEGPVASPSAITRLITAWKGGRRDLERYKAGVARRAE